ncbi:hypothetical protein CPB84DRAFT_1966585 [Gymnopilus junonius]|uniref:3'-5' exonuclease n=1 Tax=Gymnopilus junonius TaxID=109634 RepID=A0A9P5NBS0_GYMJU|nr:hypothetical protein CPB84DRAFT_1966585 [Gymnopilus junonius]
MMDKPTDMNTHDLHSSQMPANTDACSVTSLIGQDNSASQSSAKKRGQGRPKGSKNKNKRVLSNNASQSGRVLGRPPKDTIRLTTEVRTVNIKIVGSLTGWAELQTPQHDANRSFPTTVPQPLSHEETESYILPACQSLPRVNEQDGEDESDDSLAAGDSDGVNGDAATGEADFDNSDEPIGQIPLLVMDAFKRKIEYLKKLTEGHGSNTKILVYEKLESFWLPHSDAFFHLRQKFLSPEQLLIPHFFFWDPLPLVDYIPCPSGNLCTGKLVRHGYCEVLRRIINLENSFYLIYVRYRCNQCSPVCTFSSCHPLVMAKLPKPLVAQFPAYLTKHSGLSKQVFSIMRCCFQNSMGGKQFADSLNVLHRHFHELLKVQYLQTVLEHGTGIYRPFPSFESGPTAAPSGQYCQDIYDQEIEAHEKEFDQHTAQLSCRGIAIDHSHKINNAILSLIDLFSTSDGATFVVGLDTEWDVDLTAQRQGIPDHCKTAIMQIAYGNNVWIFQLSNHISQGTFPAQLLMFLENPQILKVGRNVLLDLKNLQDDSQSLTAFSGGIDLGHLAKDKGIVADARASLADLCIKALSHVLSKDPQIRISPDWSGPLTKEQIQYAALDAYASLKIYEKLDTLQVPILVNFEQELPSDYEVFIFHDDRTTIIAHGIISPDQFNSFQGINITQTCTLIQIQEIYVPGAIIHLHRDQPLSSLGSTPFNMVCRKTQVKTFILEFAPTGGNNSTETPTSDVLCRPVQGMADTSPGRPK